MMEKMKRSLRAAFHPLLMAFGSLPLLFFVLENFALPLLLHYWIFPAVYFVLLSVSLCFRGKWRLFVGGACFLLMEGVSIAWWIREGELVAFLVMLFYGILFLTGLRGEQSDKVQGVSSLVFFALHLLVQVRLLAQVKQTYAMEWMQPRLAWAFLIYMVLLMLSMNQDNLRGVAQGRHHVPTKMRRQHRLLILGFFAMTALIVLIPGLIEAIEQAWNWLMEQLRQLLKLLDIQYEEATEPTEEKKPLIPDFGVEVEVGNAIWEDWLMMIIRFLVFLSPVFLLILNWKKLWNLLKKLWAWMIHYAGAVSEEYEDEITATRQLGVRELLRKLNNPNRLSAAQERALSPGERIRYRFLRMRMKHPEWESGSTAREKLPDATAGLYEKVRYGDMPVTEAEAEQFAEAVRNL